MTISARDRDDIFRRDDYRCIYCKKLNHLQIDHVFPQSKGGPDTRANLVVMCASCNREKSDHLYMEQMVASFFHLKIVGEDIDWVESFYPLSMYGLPEVFDILIKRWNLDIAGQ